MVIVTKICAHLGLTLKGEEKVEKKMLKDLKDQRKRWDPLIRVYLGFYNFYKSLGE